MKFFFIGVGLFYFLWPKGVWHLDKFRRPKGSEPTELAITINRIMGAILILFGIYQWLFK